MAEEPSIHIIASTLSGASAEVDFPANGFVRDLKEHLAQALDLPALCQKLLLETDTLEDDKQVSEYGSEQLSLSVVVSTESMYQQLYQFESGEITMAGLRALEKLALEDQQAIDTMGMVVLHGRSFGKAWDKEFRDYVAKQLLSLAGRGNELAYQSFDEHFLDSDDPAERESAIFEIGDNMRGNEVFTSRLCESLCRHIGPKRCKPKRKGGPKSKRGCTTWLVAARLQALGKIVEEKDSKALECVLEMLREPATSGLLKLVAYDSLHHVLHAGAETVLPVTREFFISCLEMEGNQHTFLRSHKQARKTFLEHLSKHPERSDDAIVTACERILLQGHRLSSQFAGEVFPAIANAENTYVIDRLLSQMKLGVMSHQRAAAAQALGGISAKEDEQVVEELVAALSDVAEVAQAVITSLGQVGGRAALDVVLPYLEHPDGWVRQAAPAALARLAAFGDEAVVVRALVACAQSEYVDAALAALAALESMGSIALDGAFTAANACARGRDEQVRRVAVAAVGRLGKHISHSDLAVATLREVAAPACWLDQDEHVQRDAVEALRKLGSGGNVAAAAALKSLAAGWKSQLSALAGDALQRLGGEAGQPSMDNKKSMCAAVGGGKHSFTQWTRLLQEEYEQFDDVNSE